MRQSQSQQGEDIQALKEEAMEVITLLTETAPEVLASLTELLRQLKERRARGGRLEQIRRLIEFPASCGNSIFIANLK